MKKVWTLALTVVILVCFGCMNYEFIQANEKTFPAKKEPCRPKAITKFALQEEKEYTLIGFCEAKASAGEIGDRNRNNAMIMLSECSCKHGGDLVKILSHDEFQSNYRSVLLYNVNTATTIPLNKHRISRDKLYAAVYRKN